MLDRLEREQLEKDQKQVQNRIRTRKAMEVATKKARRQLKAIEHTAKQDQKRAAKRNGSDVDESEEELKSLRELNKRKKGNKEEEEDDEEYNVDVMAKRLKKMDEAKQRQIEEEEKARESRKLRVIEVHKEEVQKLHQTFGLDSIILDIQDKYNRKEYESMIEYSTKCRFLFALMQDLRREGHRMLIFSMSKKMLNLIEEILKSD